MDSDKLLEYGWVFAIVFFLVLFLSQSLYIWVLGPVGSFITWLLLIVWSFVVSNFLLFGRSSHILETIRTQVNSFVKKKHLFKEQIALDDVPEIERLQSKPKDEAPAFGQRTEHKELEDFAHNNGALISGEALRKIAVHGTKSKEVLARIIEEAKKTYPKFDGWIVLNKAQIQELENGAVQSTGGLRNEISEPNENMSTTPADKTDEKKEEKEIDVSWKENLNEYHDRSEEKIHHTPIPANLPTATLQSKAANATATLVELLCKGDEDEVFKFIRGLRQGHSNLREFISETVLLLDSVHEHRVDGVGYVEKHVLEHTQCFSNDELEELIAILIGSIDYRYKLPDLGVKLALVRAVEYIKKARTN